MDLSLHSLSIYEHEMATPLSTSFAANQIAVKGLFSQLLLFATSDYYRKVACQSRMQLT